MGLIKHDKFGLVGQPDDKYTFGLEGGDSLNWTCHEYFLTNQLLTHHILKHFEKHPGLYIRHPNRYQSDFGWASYCEGNWNGVESRDQMTGKLCFLAKAQARRALWRTFKQHVKRFLLFANNTIHNGANPKTAKWKLPDLTGPDVWALYIRGFRAWWCYPLLLIFDLHLFINCFIKRMTKDSDILSFIIKMLTAREIMPTPIIWLAFMVNSRQDLDRRLEVYWTGWRQQRGMYELYKPYLEKHWKG